MKATSSIVQVPHPLVEAARRRQEEAAAAKAAEAALPPSVFRQLQATSKRGVLFSVIPFAVLMAGLALLPIPGAVISGGYLTAESAPKQIQSAESGVVEEILVRDGDAVRSGDRLIVLDDTAARAELAITSTSLDQLRARDARLNAEALNFAAVMFPAELLIRHSTPGVGAILNAERALFTLRRQAHLSQLDQMAEQTHQLEEQVKGVEGQLASIERQHEILSKELEGLRPLLAEQLVTASAVSDAEQNLSIVEGQRSELNATIALARAKRAELGSQMAELRAQRMSDAAEEQREVQARIAELAEKQIAARRRVGQLVLAAPVDGTVTDLKVRTVGGVVTASETLATVVPTDDRLIAELRLQPRDISKVRLGQEAELHFTSIGGASAPQFAGTVIFVAPDVVVEERSGSSYFVVRVEIGEPLNDTAREMATLGAGTPVEVFILTEARTVVEYIAKPILDQARRAFR